jgi:hypothetical protein
MPSMRGAAAAIGTVNGSSTLPLPAPAAGLAKAERTTANGTNNTKTALKNILRFIASSLVCIFM